MKICPQVRARKILCGGGRREGDTESCGREGIARVQKRGLFSSSSIIDQSSFKNFSHEPWKVLYDIPQKRKVVAAQVFFWPHGWCNILLLHKLKCLMQENTSAEAWLHAYKLMRWWGTLRIGRRISTIPTKSHGGVDD